MAVSPLPRASEPREARQGHGGWGLRDLGRGERPQLPRGHRRGLREAGVQVREINAKTNAKGRFQIKKSKNMMEFSI